MILPHRVQVDFWRHLAKLPEDVQQAAQTAYDV